ncbi:MAG: HD domain-containing protein [Deltaproteobacteria bacterium]|nr:HD domain-containing protein [Deltaproteobacteria bacterium]
MKKIFVKDIKEKDHISGPFLAAKKETGIGKTGKPYLVIRLMDSTGDIEARIWDDAEGAAKRFDKDDVVAIKGYAVAYQGGIQLNVSDIYALPETDYSIRDFLPSSKRDPDEMMAELDGVISGVEDKHLKALLTSIFKDAEIRGLYKTAPAAKTMHHPYLGGLVEHVLSMCGLAASVAGHYKNGVNKDLLMAGAILHDIGKIYELSYRRSFDYTDEGRLIGHITIGVELMDAHIGKINDFPRQLAVLMKHMILSHHGQLEFGSPKRPKTLEAIILSYLDDMDAKVAAVKALIGNNGKVNDSNWTPYQKLFERYIYKGGWEPVPEDLNRGGEKGNPDEKPGKDPKGGNTPEGPLPLFK